MVCAWRTAQIKERLVKDLKPSVLNNTCHPRIIPAVCWSCSAALWAIWSEYCRISRVCWSCVLTLCDIKCLCYSSVTLLWMWLLCASINSLYIFVSLSFESSCFTPRADHPLLNSLKANQLLMFHRPLPGWLVAWSASINLLSHFNDLYLLPEMLLLRTWRQFTDWIIFIMKQGPKIRENIQPTSILW